MKSTMGVTCKLCGDSGWVIKTTDGNESVQPCPDCRARKRLQKLLESAEIPSRYFDRGFDVYEAVHPSQRKALEKSIRYVEAFPETSRGLLFVGKCGVGKTHLSVAILKSLIVEKRIAGKFVDETELLRRLQHSYGPDSPETEREVLLPLRNADLLVWDDLGTGRPSEWVAETIRTVLNHRYTHNKHTILSTNLPLRNDVGTVATNLGTWQSPEQTLSKRIGVPLFSRILEMCEIVEIDGLDFRTQIHKPSKDAQESQQRRLPKPNVPVALLQCPECMSKSIVVIDTSKPKRTGSATFFEASVQCRACSHQFAVRYQPKMAKVEYL